MNDRKTIGANAAGEISKAVSGIEALLKQLHTTAEEHMVLYGIMSNIATIRMVLAETPRATSH
jgi:hypothetical protein